METKEKKAPAKAEVKKDTWEYKDRNYYLAGGKEPLTFKMPSRHTSRHPMFWFDEKAGYNRELRYATNQKSVFVDEQQGPVTLAHIIFNDGTLFVPKEKVQLQKLLSLYHPAKNKLYHEYDKVEEAKDELDFLQIELQAMNIASKLDLDHAEAILRVEQGSSVTSMTSKEIKRDLLVFAKRKPDTFLALVEDENVILRNFAIKAKEENIIKLSQDQRTFTWGSNDKKLMTVPFDENPYSAMAAWFQTDEGLQVYKSIEKKFK
tara:strand:+ start:9 stop:794 length:786 start_codon:yes stop_codon:yes gene_type:complete